MQYCPNCKVQIRGIKARCPLCQRELLPAAYRSQPVETKKDVPKDVSKPDLCSKTRCGEANRHGSACKSAIPAQKTAGIEEEEREPGREAEASAPVLVDDDPFVHLPAPKVSFMLMVRVVAFCCVSLEILFGAAQVITGFKNGWILAVMLIVLLAWGDFMVAAYYRNNLIRMLTMEAYFIMAACLLIAAWTGSGSWAVSWAVPGLFFLLVLVTFAAARGQKMQLQEFILYPAFDLLMCLLQIIPIALGHNPLIAPAVISIALMLILVSSLVIFRGRMLREAAAKYMHM